MGVQIKKQQRCFLQYQGWQAAKLLLQQSQNLSQGAWN